MALIEILMTRTNNQIQEMRAAYPNGKMMMIIIMLNLLLVA
jgi:hypothetical protein